MPMALSSPFVRSLCFVFCTFFRLFSIYSCIILLLLRRQHCSIESIPSSIIIIITYNGLVDGRDSMHRFALAMKCPTTTRIVNRSHCWSSERKKKNKILENENRSTDLDRHRHNRQLRPSEFMQVWQTGSEMRRGLVYCDNFFRIERRHFLSLFLSFLTFFVRFESTFT